MSRLYHQRRAMADYRAACPLRFRWHTVVDQIPVVIKDGSMSLNTRKLGSQGLEVSAIGLGCMGMSQSYGPADEAESIATLHRSIELGCSFLDTAEVYGPFKNEELLGRALAGKRGQAQLATKFGFRIEGGRMTGTNSHPDQIRKAVEGSLQRLNTDHIDLLF